MRVPLAVLLAVVLLAPPAMAQTAEAPGAPGVRSEWTTGAKTGVGTSTTLESKVWFTLAGGILTDVYYPTVEVGNVQDLQFIVSDGRTFAELERDATDSVTALADPRALLYRQTNTARSGRYRITKTYVTDPARSVLAVDVEFTPLDGGDYQLYVLANPSLANSGLGDAGATAGDALVASDADVASALAVTGGFSATSSGYSETSDGWSDLRTDYDLDGRYATAGGGNLVQTGQVPLAAGGSTRFTLALAFGATREQALADARGTLAAGFADVAADYVQGWRDYLDGLTVPPLTLALEAQYRVALMTLRAHEDKTYRGANIASLTVPRGQAVNADQAGVGGYHLVWSRDLYHVATALLAAGDDQAAQRSLDYLFEVQQRADGSFPQNSRLDGTPYWTGLQLDEVAFPLVLAYQLGRDDASTWSEHVKPAADFLVANGPSTPQERWEEEGGYSPSTIAAEIAGLVAAAEIAEANRDSGSAALYRGVADDWQQRLDDWLVTSTGPLSGDPYYLRINADDDPDDGDRLELNNGAGTFDERSVVDAGFLELTRLGVRPPDDPLVAASLEVVDATIRRDTPGGPFWYRYNADGYGEKTDGSPYDGTGIGRLWPLLTGERGEYELANGRTALPHLRAMADSANDGLMIPEQVWDSPDPTAYGFALGEGTGSATPLAWSMAQFVRLALSIEAGTPVETPAAVAARYATGRPPTGPGLVLDSAVARAGTVTVSGRTTAPTVYVNAGARTVRARVTPGGRFAVEVLLGPGQRLVTAVGLDAADATTLRRRVLTFSSSSSSSSG